MIELHVERTDHPSAVRRFSAAEISIGRASECDLTLDDPSVSRRHCRLTRGATGWTIEDLGSANGTILDDSRITDIQPIPSDTVITVGAFRLTVRVLADPTPTIKPRTSAIWPRTRKLAVASLAVTLACIGGWTSARVWDAPLRLPTATLDCPADPDITAIEATLATSPTTPAEETITSLLTALARTDTLPTACALRPRVEASLEAALARMDHQHLGHHDAAIVALAPIDDSRVAALDRDGRILLHDRTRPATPLPTPETSATALAHSPDARWLAAGTDDGRVLLFDLPTDRPATPLPHGPSTITAVQFTDATHLWSVDTRGTLHLWTFTTDWTRTATTTAWPGIHTLLPARDRMVAFGPDRAAVFTSDLRRPALPLTTGAALSTLAVAPGGADIITGDLAGKVTRWRLGRTMRPEPLTSHGAKIRAVAMHAGLVASVGDDDALRLVEVDRRVRRGAGPPLVLLAEVPVPVDRLALGDGWLIGSGPEGAVVTWDLSQRTRRLPATVHDGHRGDIITLALTRTWAVTGGSDGDLRLWPTVPPEQTDTPLHARACTAIGWPAPLCH